MFFPNYINNYAYRIVFALIKIAEYIRQDDFSEAINRNALKLLHSMHYEDSEEIISDLGESISLITLAGQGRYLPFEQARAMTAALNKFKEKVEQVISEKDSDLEKVLSGLKDNGLVRSEAGEDSKKLKEARFANSENYNLSKLEKGDILEKLNSSEGDSSEDKLPNSVEMGVGERRRKILDKIKEKKFCFLKDLIFFFPGISERTIRYDLERLAADGLVEKVGSSGPGTFYRAK